MGSRLAKPLKQEAASKDNQSGRLAEDSEKLSEVVQNPSAAEDAPSAASAEPALSEKSVELALSEKLSEPKKMPASNLDWDWPDLDLQLRPQSARSRDSGASSSGSSKDVFFTMWVSSCTEGSSSSSVSTLRAEQLAEERRQEEQALQQTVRRTEDGETTSIGSALHGSSCGPCIFFALKTCSAGIRCSFCHFPHGNVRPRANRKMQANGKSSDSKQLSPTPATASEASVALHNSADKEASES